MLQNIITAVAIIVVTIIVIRQLPSIIVITDCKDSNAKGRLLTMVHKLFPLCPVIFIGADNEHEAAGNILDQLEILHSKRGIFLVNVAPRNHGNTDKHFNNGTPFCWTKFNNSFICSTVDGLTLSLIKKINDGKLTVNLMNIPNVVKKLLPFSPKKQKEIIETQFRSLFFLPWVAQKIAFLGIFNQKIIKLFIPSEKYDKIADFPPSCWYVDVFGNIKTSLSPSEISFGHEREITISWTKGETKSITCYARLKDVPVGEFGIIVGSSGFKQNFIEIVINGGKADEQLGIKTGDKISFS